jgi:hypothetical protein
VTGWRPRARSPGFLHNLDARHPTHRSWSNDVRLVTTALAALCLATPALGQDETDGGTSAIDFKFEPADGAALAPTIFGDAGTRWWRIHGGGGTSVNTRHSGNDLAFLGVGVSWFVADWISVDLELNAMYFWQEGDDAFGGNFNLLFRWHFITRDGWTVYIDGGAGLLGTTSDVPFNGSSFNFTPQAGLGMTFELDGNKQLMIGARWHHISNANLSENNPGRDSIIGYVGISMPF